MTAAERSRSSASQARTESQRPRESALPPRTCRPSVVLVLSADSDWRARLHRLCAAAGMSSLRFEGDPEAFLALLRLAHSSSRSLSPGSDGGTPRVFGPTTSSMANSIRGIIFELAIPSCDAARSVGCTGMDANQSPFAVDVAWHFVHAVRLLTHLTLEAALVVSADAHLDPVLHPTHLGGLAPSRVTDPGLPVVQRIDPDADATTWRAALLRFRTSTQFPTPQTSDQAIEATTHVGGHALPSLSSDRLDGVPSDAKSIALRLWFQPEACILWCLRGQGSTQHYARISLTAREAALLSMLLRARGRYLSAYALAEGLPSSTRYIPDAHAIAQTLSGLRCKLRDVGHSALLTTKRGLGYAFAPPPAPTSHEG